MIFVPLTVFYTPLLFGFDKKEELTEEAKKKEKENFISGSNMSDLKIYNLKKKKFLKEIF